ncbi:very short patch repair endonuclease [candidate division WOR-1 bacterium RIFOXYB2_FULL_42_35]|uniref:Very short patch repair endonuclease n=1 Tax=candidate division WOR-1 bacterium RIFOXYC2_FULL_41_25 TaxID=1802586 RepID=A0A1F4TJW9_UNCSA|nr:MAG: very short patch repair endonuclease [candidate division WOR-1 bacterium RIFOXYA2_FULL_41_14]OGC21680.1 MAG: very short patch repair endonuclease [candidate division WOR-1 bacterium RIFOXYB2_FULL_42_35]OGC32859.1 MAG: very short patch repair endonuclease [candidate division WOR-1 bacterium RIFOXYC2_FULL_41_25]OGC42867.1 MAG: very short patch repair endonuclease [candidate division WOR-1 bacterium RIFOXYD2_FULL_41_8]
MTDNLTKKQRSNCMSRIRSKHTKPEKIVRRILRKLAVSFRTYAKNLPGNPDIIISKRKTAVFVNGCFWHLHNNCKKAVAPKSNIQYWKTKLQKNIMRQRKDIRNLRKLGWKSLIIWECQTKQECSLFNRISRMVN